MDKTFQINISNKIATNLTEMNYICGNSDYKIDFLFDSDWDDYETKTARFIYSLKEDPIDVIFSGNICEIPTIYNSSRIKVGVFAGNIKCTTPATIYAKSGILDYKGIPIEPSEDIYNQIMERLNELDTLNPEAIAAAVADYIAENNIIQSPTSAKVGQTIVVKEIDENGKPISWKMVDLPEDLINNEISYLII